MTGPRRAGFAAQMEALGDALAFVEFFCSDRDIARDDGLRLTLVVEEMFTNTVSYGEPGDGAPRIEIELDADAASVHMLYEDTLGEFDPLAHLAGAAPAPESDDDAPVGGLGIVLVARFAQDLQYERSGGRNRLRMRLLRSATTPAPPGSR